MPQVWFKSGETPAAVLLAEDRRYVLSSELWANGDCPVGVLAEGETAAPGVPVLTARTRPDRPAAWRLFAPDGQRVTVGSLPVLGMRVLRDRDRIRVGSALLYYSDADVPVPVRQTVDYAGRCSRCQGDLVAGQWVVRCPHCHRRYHQDEASGFHCWTYPDDQGRTSPCHCGHDTGAAVMDWVPFRYGRVRR